MALTNSSITSSMDIMKDKELAHLQRLCTSLPKAMPKTYAFKIIQMHIQQMSDLNHSVKSDTSEYAGYTSLHFLTESNSINEHEIIQLIEWFLNQGVEVNAQNAIGSTVVHIAAEASKKALLEYLFLCDKLHMNLVNNKGLSYLHIACMMSNTEIIGKVLDHIDADIINKQMNFLNYATRDKWILDKLYIGGETALHIAVLDNNLEIVQLLINHGVDLNRKDDKGLTPLCYASNLNLIKIKWVLRETMSKSPTCKESSKTTTYSSALQKPLLVANSKTSITGYSDFHLKCMENNVLEIKRLITQKVDVNISISENSLSWSGFTGLHIAVKQGNLKICQLLLNNGADANVKDTKGITPLHLAVQEKRWNISELLINHGADLWAKSVERMTPLHFALKEYCKTVSIEPYVHEKIIHFYTVLIQSKEEIFVDDLGISLLHIACIIDNQFIVKQILQNEIAINSCINVDSHIFPGYTPLHLAVNFKNTQLVKMLLDNGADFTLMNSDGLTPLHLSQKLGSYEIVELIFSTDHFNIDNPISSEGISHFHIACMNNRIDAIEKYLKHKIDTNHPIDFFATNELNGCTPLHIAVNYCYIDLVKILLNHKDILINSVDSIGSTPLHYACNGTIKNANPKAEIVEILLEHGADPNSEDFLGRRPIEIAIKQDNEVLLKKLLQYKVNVNYFNVLNGFNPLLSVIDSTTLNYQMFKMLLNGGADVSVKSEAGMTVMHKIVSKAIINLKFNRRIGTAGLEKLISCLCWRGCDIDSRDELGRTSLHIAIQYCNMNGALALLKNGADINIIDNFGFIAMDYYEKYRLKINYEFNHYFMHHLLKLKTCKLHIDKKNNEWYSKLYNLQIKAASDQVNLISYSISLLEELETMKHYNLSTYTTLFDILHKSSTQMATLVGNQMFRHSLRAKFIFLEYKNLLLMKYNKGLISKSLIQPAEGSFTKLLGEFKLPNTCLELTFKFLTIDDMRRFIESSSV